MIEEEVLNSVFNGVLKICYGFTVDFVCMEKGVHFLPTNDYLFY